MKEELKNKLKKGVKIATGAGVVILTGVLVSSNRAKDKRIKELETLNNQLEKEYEKASYKLNEAFYHLGKETLNKHKK